MGIDFKRPRHIRGFRLGEVLIFGPGIGRILVEKTVSGAIAHIDDGADDVPLKKCEITLPASLDGYSSVDVVASGKNLANIGAVESCSNRPGSITQNNDGSITVTTGTQQNVKSLQKLKDIIPYVKVGETCIFSANTTGKQKQIYLHQVSTLWSFGTSKTITQGMLDSDVSFYASGANGTTVTISDFQVEYGTTATTYEPYTAPTQYTASLGRTIYGGTVDMIKGTAEPTNWLNNTLATQTVNGTTFTVNADKSITVSGTPSQQTRVYISQEAITINEAMFFSFGTMPTGTRVFCSRTSGASTSYPTISPSHTATLDAVYTNFLLEIGTTFDGTPFTIYPLCNKGSSASDYSPYFAPFTFTPITPTPETELGVNNFWADTGDSQVTYYAYAD